MRVLSTFLKAGVPISEISLFGDLLKKNSDRLAGRKVLSDLILFVLHCEKDALHSEIAGKHVQQYLMEQRDLARHLL